jgi:hypothetical protein
MHRTANYGAASVTRARVNVEAKLDYIFFNPSLSRNKINCLYVFGSMVVFALPTSVGAAEK